MIYRLDNELWFPTPYNGEPDGLIAIGGDLSIDRLLLAYSNGIFPWYSFRDTPILWYCPLQRFVIYPEEIHISHSMRSFIQNRSYEVSFNNDFEGVIKNCSQLRIKDEGAWLGEDMIKAYTRLHEQNFATSVEVWNEKGKLVGGLYGVTISNVFCGESMFSLEPNTSKLALIHLAHILKKTGNAIIDCQMETPHLKSMGGRFIPYKEYMKYLLNEVCDHELLL